MITINDDLSSHIISDDGTLECFLASHNPETQKPFASQAEVEAFISTVYNNSNYWQPYKTSEERAQIEAARKSESNAGRAKGELQATDWVENASVRDTSVTPHLTNVADFDAYRLALRLIAVTKPSTVDVWPSAPQATWSTNT
jgi:hypothetical protein